MQEQERQGRVRRQGQERATCTPPRKDTGDPFVAGGAAIGSLRKPTTQVDWCEQPVDTDCQTLYMLHELAHTCGWKDRDFSKGVPHDLKCQLLKN